jgi:hypothetical protein
MRRDERSEAISKEFKYLPGIIMIMSIEKEKIFFF